MRGRPLPSANLLPNLRHLQLFLQVVSTGSISAAARNAHLSQPAVSQAVSGIEAALGASLLKRTPEGLRPGAEAVDSAKRIARAIEGLREAAQQSSARSTPGARADADVLRGITAAQLRALVAVAEHGGFARAADQTGQARASVHRAVRQLERSLGAPLFETTSFGIRPTREGERLALRTQLALAELAQARAEIATAAGAGSGSTVIGAMPLARSELVPRAVLEFSQHRPEHAISILDGPYDSMLTALRRGAADILVGALRDPPPFDDVQQEHLFDDPLAIVMRAGHPLEREHAVTLSALARFPWIVPRAESPLRRQHDALFRRLTAPRAIAPIECSSLVAARALLMASDRVMLLSAYQINNELRAGQLVARPHPLGQHVRAIGLTSRRHWHPTQIQLQLLETLRRHARTASLPNVR